MPAPEELSYTAAADSEIEVVEEYPLLRQWPRDENSTSRRKFFQAMKTFLSFPL